MSGSGSVPTVKRAAPRQGGAWMIWVNVGLIIYCWAFWPFLMFGGKSFLLGVFPFLATFLMLRAIMRQKALGRDYTANNILTCCAVVVALFILTGADPAFLLFPLFALGIAR